MRITIAIDDKLLAEALHATGTRTKREVVELGLKTLMQLARQREIRRLRGKIQWASDFDFTRTSK